MKQPQTQAISAMILQWSKSACNSTYSVAKLHWCMNTPDFSSLMSLLETTLQRHMIYTESQTQLQRHDTYRSRVTNTVHRRRNPVRIVGTLVSMRVDKVGGAMQNCGQVNRVRSLCAQSGCANHWKFNGRPSLRVPPGFFVAEYHVYVCILQTGGGVLTFRRIVSASYPNFVGAHAHCPPQFCCLCSCRDMIYTEPQTQSD